MTGKVGPDSPPIEDHRKTDSFSRGQGLEHAEQALAGLVPVTGQLLRQLVNGVQGVVSVHDQMFLHFPLNL